MMKRLTVTLAALTIAAAQAALAQPPGPPGGGRGGPPQIDRLTHELDLSDAQKAKVQQILDAERTKREAAREADKAAGTQLTPEQRRARGEAAHQELITQLSAVLTPAQMAKFQQLEQQRRQRPGPAPGEQ